MISLSVRTNRGHLISYLAPTAKHLLTIFGLLISPVYLSIYYLFVCLFVSPSVSLCLFVFPPL